MLKPKVYLDQNALTALLKEASEELVRILAETWEIFYSSATSRVRISFPAPNFKKLKSKDLGFFFC